jgi:hypothetical protein
MLDGDFTPIPRELPVEVDSAGEESEQMESPVEEAAS